MKGYIVQRRGRFYAVIYEGRDPVTGKERRAWHPAGTDRAKAEQLARKLAAAETKRVDAVRSLTFGAYLTSQWLPTKELHLATSTYRGYERNVRRHILPALGRTSIRRLRYQQIKSLYDSLLHPDSGRGLSPKTVYELHLIIRGALTDAHRRGLVTRNVALVARAPNQRPLPRPPPLRPRRQARCDDDRVRRDAAGSLFEAEALLFGPDERDHCFDLLGGQAIDRRHVAEGPVMPRGAVGDGETERVIEVMVGFVHDRQVRGPFVGAAQVGAVTRGAALLVDLGAEGEDRIVTRRCCCWFTVRTAGCGAKRQRRHEDSGGQEGAGVHEAAPINRAVAATTAARATASNVTTVRNRTASVGSSGAALSCGMSTRWL